MNVAAPVLLLGLVGHAVCDETPEGGQQSPATAQAPARAGSQIAQPSSPFDQITALRDQEKWSEAAERSRAFLREHPDDPRVAEARFWAGYCLVKLEEYEEAVDVLHPFETELAGDKWADDALVQLGEAHLGQENPDLALVVWNRLLEKYVDSVWRTDVLIKLVELHFDHGENIPACLEACRRAVAEIKDRDSTGEARYLGAYCLNALHKFEESKEWCHRHFDTTRALEEAWRHALQVQRELIEGRTESIRVAVEAIDRNFPDLDQDDRLDLTLRLAGILRRNHQSDLARARITAELERSADRAEEDLEALMDELEEVIGENWDEEVRDALDKLADNPRAPLVVRVVARERQVQSLCDAEASDQAETVLRKELSDEPSEFARCRFGLMLAEVLADDRDDHSAALKVLNEVLATLKRNDLIHRVKEAIDGQAKHESIEK
jgi:tetratricopeptide (TPR) repeat protein